MRMEQLRCLVDIAQTHSITNTAQRLFMTQQAVSQRIKQLEQDLGVELLIRTNAGVQLTQIGEDVAVYAQQILDTEQSIVQLCENRKAQLKEDMVQIQVCSTSSVANIVLPDIVAKLDAQQKNISLKIVLSNDIDDVLYQVQSGVCNIGFVTYNKYELQRKHAVFSNELQIEILAQDEPIAVLDRKFCREGQNCLSEDDCVNRIVTQYNLLAIDAVRENNQKMLMVSSNDADFHRRMIDKAGAIVIMPGLAYQYFFNAKKYIGLPLDVEIAPLVHAAVFRKDADAQLVELVMMIRREMYLK